MAIDAYPLTWPDGWPRTDPHRRLSDRKFGGSIHGLTVGRARDLLFEEIRRLGAKGTVVSSNLPLRPDGLPYADSRRIDDPGIAVYFTLDGEQLAMARDLYGTGRRAALAHASGRWPRLGCAYCQRPRQTLLSRKPYCRPLLSW
jgi:hypothetical protein